MFGSTVVYQQGCPNNSCKAAMLALDFFCQITLKLPNHTVVLSLLSVFLIGPLIGMQGHKEQQTPHGQMHGRLPHWLLISLVAILW